MKVARGGELLAEQWLELNGFHIEGEQVREETAVLVDGRLHVSEVRVDYLASRDDRKYLIEVKTGGKAPDPTHPATRRQLLEYSILFPDRKILLLDMAEKQAHLIEFPWFQD